MSLAEFLKEELVDDTVFTIPIGNGIGVSESTVVSWVVMAVIILLCIILGSKLKVDHISKRQAAAEFIVTKLESVVGGIVGEGGKGYVPYLVTVLLYLGFANIIGVFGFKPPTKSLVVTGALAIMSIILVEAAGIRAKGAKGWLHSFIEPMPIVAPFNILMCLPVPCPCACDCLAMCWVHLLSWKYWIMLPRHSSPQLQVFTSTSLTAFFRPMFSFA